jgi:hypothetical protein
MTWQTFKVGDRVRVKTSIGKGMVGAGKEGVIIRDRLYSSRWMYEVSLDNGGDYFFNFEHLEPLPKTLDTLTEGDVVVDKDDTDDTMTVEHVLKPGLYVLLDSDNDTGLYNTKELARRGFVPQQDPESEKTSMTVAEVAKKLGLNPDKLHIVADKEAA